MNRMLSSFLALVIILLSVHSQAAVQSPKVPVTPKWLRFEESFKSSTAYSNPLQEAVLAVFFISPSGKTNQVHGFWDGGKTWRVRFAPDEIGRWSFQTSCSDVSNRGLHNQTGRFICTAPIASARFAQHGPVQIARDHRHFEHADGTPFFWLADTIWNAPRVSDPRDFLTYATTRVFQKFTVAQWSLAPGRDAKGEAAWFGTARIAINPAFFQRLDAKLETLSHAGILSCIAPLDELDPALPTSPSAQAKGSRTSDAQPATLNQQLISDDQAALLLRYVVARWQAEPVAWLLLFEGDSQARQASRWKKLGQTVFGAAAHAPVILFTRDTPWVLNEFRDQSWADVFAYQTLTDTSDDAVKWAISGPLGNEWKNEPARPVLAFTPPENGVIPNSGKRFSADEVRHAAWWSLLLAPPAGVNYSAHGVLNWDETIDTSEARSNAGALPLWNKSLFMPAARQMTHLARTMTSVDFWQLRPRPEFVATQPGTLSPRRYISGAGTEKNDRTLVYVPGDRTLDLALPALPSAPVVTWLNPRTGETNAAVAVVGSQSCQFPTPDPGDWLLFMKAGK
jgi:hypothetical protein